MRWSASEETPTKIIVFGGYPWLPFNSEYCGKKEERRGREEGKRRKGDVGEVRQGGVGKVVLARIHLSLWKFMIQSLHTKYLS